MNTRRAVILAFLVAAGILLQILESFVPVVMLVPGYKIGLANIAGLFALYAYGPKDMMIVTVCRIFLAGLLTGSLFSVGFMLSVSGAILALLAITLAKRSGLFSIYGVSVAGAAAHSVGQVLAVTAIYQQYFMQMFLPVLLALSIVSGLLIALVTERLLKRMKHTLARSQGRRL